MALSVNDIVQITDVQTYLGQTMLNVYFYRVVTLESLTDYNDVDQAFINTIWPEMLPIQSLGVAHVGNIIKNLTNGLDIFTGLDTDSGEATGDGAPSFTSLGFRLNRSTALTRHGSKRIGGISEAASVGNELASAYITPVNDLAAVMGGVIERDGTVDHDVTLEPVIIGRIPTGEPGAGELDLSIVNPVSGAQFVRVTTQTTRRAGRGV